MCKLSDAGRGGASPRPVSCRCPAPADYCTPAPESDVPADIKINALQIQLFLAELRQAGS